MSLKDNRKVAAKIPSNKIKIKKRTSNISNGSSVDGKSSIETFKMKNVKILQQPRIALKAPKNSGAVSVFNNTLKK